MGCCGKGWFASVQRECTINVTELFNWSCIESGIESSAVESKLKEEWISVVTLTLPASDRCACFFYFCVFHLAGTFIQSDLRSGYIFYHYVPWELNSWHF